MPDWITHIVVAWISCTILGFKFRSFDTENTVLAMVGALIPDIFKIYIPLDFMGIYVENFIFPIHLPAGSLILALIFSLFFKDKKMALLFFSYGIFSHYALDSLLTYVSGGMALLFPFSWMEWQLRLISVDDYYLMILAVFVALIVYAVSKKKKKEFRLIA